MALDDSSSRLAPYDPKEDEPKWTNFQRHGYDHLVARGVTGLPERGEPFREFGISHPVLWFVLGLVICVGGLLGLARPPNDHLLQDDLLVLDPSIAEFGPLAIAGVVSMGVLLICGRALGAAKYSAQAFQFIGESVVLIPALGRYLLDRATRDSVLWPTVRRRWVLELWLLAAFPLAIHGWVLARAYSTSTSVTAQGIRKTQFGKTTEYGWAGLREVQSSCDEERRELYYDATFEGGVSFQLVREDGSGLEVINLIDQKLMALGKRKIRLPKDDALRCVARWPQSTERPIVEEILSR